MPEVFELPPGMFRPIGTESGLHPALASIGRHVDPRNLRVAAPRKSSDEDLSGDGSGGTRSRDYRLHGQLRQFHRVFRRDHRPGLDTATRIPVTTLYER